MPNQTHTVPNQPRTPQRAVRIPDNIWFPVGEAMRRRGDTRSDVMRDSLAAYLHFTDEQWEQVHEVADREGMSRADLFSTAIMDYVERHRQ